MKSAQYSLYLTGAYSREVSTQGARDYPAPELIRRLKRSASNCGDRPVRATLGPSTHRLPHLVLDSASYIRQLQHPQRCAVVCSPTTEWHQNHDWILAQWLLS